MQPPKRIIIVVGTRPEVIKMAPVYLAMNSDSRVEPILLATGQHRQMLDQAFAAFGIFADIDLNLMTRSQTPAALNARIITAIQKVLVTHRPDAVLVHGDTTTCLASALAAFYTRIPVGHVEAGLRTYDFDAPWPEEMNRRLVDPISRWCFAPTERAAQNLRAERVPENAIIVTGNTVVDALLFAREKIRDHPPSVPGLPEADLHKRKLVLVTGHRRESFGGPLEQLCLALRDIVSQHRDVILVYPVHLNPNVQKPVRTILKGEKRIRLIEPLEYLPFVYLMNRCELIITDSGGIQEEAPTLAKPVLVTRRATERPEAVETGLARLVGTDRNRILTEASRILSNVKSDAETAKWVNPYGDGMASQRIVNKLCASFGL